MQESEALPRESCEGAGARLMASFEIGDVRSRRSTCLNAPTGRSCPCQRSEHAREGFLRPTPEGEGRAAGSWQ